MFEIKKHKDVYHVVFMEKQYIFFEIGTPSKEEKYSYDEHNKVQYLANPFFANRIGFEHWQIEYIFTTQFNAIKDGSFLDFKTREDAERALKWVESRYIMKKLANE